MKLLDTIQNNLRLYQGMTQAKVSYDFLKTQKEEDLLRLSEQINQMDASKIILMLQESAVAYLIKDPKFLPDLIRLECEEKISINSINSMLAHAGEDVLSVNFKYEELYEVLTDERIFNQWKYEYLKYYSKCGFDSRQILDLMDGISKLSSYADFTLSELSNTERLLLIEPFFRSGLINEVISDRTVWKYFEEPEVKEILNICASSPIYDSVYYEVEAAGDLDEDEFDSKISCTEIYLLKRLTLEQLLFEALIYMVEHPERTWNGYVKKEYAEAHNGFAVVRGKNPNAHGQLGDILILLKEEDNCSAIEEVAFLKIDGKKCYPGIRYTVKGIENHQEAICA